MKKWVVGCLVTLVVLLLCAGGVVTSSYLLLYRPYVAPAAVVESGKKVDSQIANDSAYTPPTDGRLSEEQVTRFVTVESRVQTKLGPQTAVIRQSFEDVQRASNAGRRPVPLAVALRAVGQASTALLIGKTVRLGALNETRFSMDEFRWVRLQLYQAGGVDLWAIDLDGMETGAQDLMRQRGILRSMADSAFSGVHDDGRQVELLHRVGKGTVPDGNAALVASCLAQLKEWSPLAFFDL